MPTRIYYPRYLPLPKPVEKVTEVKIVEKVPLVRSNSYVSIVETKDEVKDTVNNEYKYDYKYDYKLTEEVGNKTLSKTHSKSMTNISKNNFKEAIILNPEPATTTVTVTPAQAKTNSVTYVFEHEPKENTTRHVTYVKHTNNDSGSSLAGSLCSASSTFLPVNRSVNVGPIFNGNTFGILCKPISFIC